MVRRAAALFAACVPAFAHGFAGNRFFPATLATDDPFVADELSLPTFQAIRQPGDHPTKTSTCQQTLPSNSLRILESKLATVTSSKRRWALTCTPDLITSKSAPSTSF